MHAAPSIALDTAFNTVEHALQVLVKGDLQDPDLPCVATAAHDLQKAWRLVNECYISKGYSSTPGALWYDRHFLEPRSTCFITHGARPATMTVIFDSLLGLPADQVFSPELDALRREGRRLCEFTALAHANPHQDLDIQSVYELFRHAWLTAAHLEKASDIIISVNPRHVPFYRRCLLFERLSPVRSFDKVGGAPAVLMRLDLLLFETRCRERIPDSSTTYFYHDDPRRGGLMARIFRQRHAPDPWVLAWFFRHDRDLIGTFTPRQQAWIMQQHPGLADLLREGSPQRDSGRLLAVG